MYENSFIIPYYCWLFKLKIWKKYKQGKINENESHVKGE